MSAIQVLQDLQHKLHGAHTSARKRWAEGGEGANQAEVIDGIQVEIKYEGSNRRSDYRAVILDGHHFARETETIPFSIFKDISTHYTCFIELRRQPAIDFLSGLGLEPGSYDLEDEWYPPEEGEPQVMLFTKEFDVVIKVWKAWKEKFIQ